MNNQEFIKLVKGKIETGQTPITDEFLREKYSDMSKSDCYIETARKFEEMNSKKINPKNYEPQNEEELFYVWLKEQEESKYREVISLNNLKPEILSEVDIFCEKLSNENNIVSQSWHFLVSWCARKEFYLSNTYSEFCTKHGKNMVKISNDFWEKQATDYTYGILTKRIRCREFWLWICEILYGSEAQQTICCKRSVAQYEEGLMKLGEIKEEIKKMSCHL